MQPVSNQLNALVLSIAKEVWPQGYDTSLNAPETFKALKEEYAARGRITVFSGASDKTIFANEEVNIAFRAWHDWAHLQVGGNNFNVDSEREACELQLAMIKERVNVGLAVWFCKIVDAEIMGQAQHWKKYRSFVDEQKDFVLAYIRNPEKALSKNWG